jgi:hypothetical protein
MIWDRNPHALYKMTQKTEGARLGVVVWIAFLDGRPTSVRLQLKTRDRYYVHVFSKQSRWHDYRNLLKEGSSEKKCFHSGITLHLNN